MIDETVPQRPGQGHHHRCDGDYRVAVKCYRFGVLDGRSEDYTDFGFAIGMEWCDYVMGVAHGLACDRTSTVYLYDEGECIESYQYTLEDAQLILEETEGMYGEDWYNFSLPAPEKCKRLREQSRRTFGQMGYFGGWSYMHEFE